MVLFNNLPWLSSSLSKSTSKPLINLFKHSVKNSLSFNLVNTDLIIFLVSLYLLLGIKAIIINIARDEKVDI